MLMLRSYRMKQRSTTPVSKASLAAKGAIVAVTIMALTMSPYSYVDSAKAVDYDAQIQALENEIKQYNQEASKLKDKRQTLQSQLAKLTNEKNQIQAKLDISIAKANKLEKEIKINEQKILDNKSVLGDTIADMYVDSNISPLEMLASSNNIAHYVDKQANQEQIQNTLQDTIDEIDALKEKLVEQKKDVDRAINDQKFARKALIDKENQKQTLISKTRGKESAFQSLSAKTERQKAQLEQEQKAALAARMAAANSGGGGNVVAGDPNMGGYPSDLANAPKDSMVDPWGMYNRECVSYTAWKVHQKTGNMPYWGGVGNANQWPGSADSAGIPRGNTPKAGSVGVIMAGYYGHVVWVEKVNSDGTINISQMNFDLNGNYSEAYNVSPSTYDTFIYF
jgi:peptidoglycan DL-endopeptidase CwlO